MFLFHSHFPPRLLSAKYLLVKNFNGYFEFDKPNKTHRFHWPNTPFHQFIENAKKKLFLFPLFKQYLVSRINFDCFFRSNASKYSPSKDKHVKHVRLSSYIPLIHGTFTAMLHVFAHVWSNTGDDFDICLGCVCVGNVATSCRWMRAESIHSVAVRGSQLITLKSSKCSCGCPIKIVFH